jgi:glutathione transport system permease protein
LFGVDPLGRDIFSRILMVTHLADRRLRVGGDRGLFGTALGLVAGYREGW